MHLKCISWCDHLIIISTPLKDRYNLKALKKGSSGVLPTFPIFKNIQIKLKTSEKDLEVWPLPQIPHGRETPLSAELIDYSWRGLRSCCPIACGRTLLIVHHSQNKASIGLARVSTVKPTAPLSVKQNKAREAWGAGGNPPPPLFVQGSWACMRRLQSIVIIVHPKDTSMVFEESPP